MPVKGKYLPAPPSGREWATPEANLRGARMNHGIRILPLPSANVLLGVWLSG